MLPPIVLHVFNLETAVVRSVLCHCCLPRWQYNLGRLAAACQPYCYVDWNPTMCACGLAQALISLYRLYEAARAAGAPCAAEPEFRAYHLLTLIGSHGRYAHKLCACAGRTIWKSDFQH